MLYALVTFHWRAKSIRMRGQGGFDDRFGPTVLAIALLAAVAWVALDQMGWTW